MTRDLGGKKDVDDDDERKNRLEQMAVLAAGLAHDLNSPVVELGLQIGKLGHDLASLEKHLGAPSPAAGAAVAALRASLKSAEEVSDYMARVLREFMRIGRGRGARGKVTTVGRALDVAARFTRSRLIDLATLTRVVDGHQTVAVSETTLVRVLVTLLLNAAEAFARPSPVTNRVTVTGGTLEDLAFLDVRDNAGGIPAPVLDRLFEPFTTSKRAARGLGLAVARSLLREVGGDLLLRETGPEGTTFRCLLPLPLA